MGDEENESHAKKNQQTNSGATHTPKLLAPATSRFHAGIGLSILIAGIVLPASAYAISERLPSNTPTSNRASDAHRETDSQSTGADDNNMNEAKIADEETSVTVEIESSDQSATTQDRASTANPKVTVNGQNIPVPANGRVHETIKTSDNNTTLNVNSRSSHSGSVSTDIKIQAETYSSSSNDSSGDQRDRFSPHR